MKIKYLILEHIAITKCLASCEKPGTAATIEDPIEEDSSSDEDTPIPQKGRRVLVTTNFSICVKFSKLPESGRYKEVSHMLLKSTLDPCPSKTIAKNKKSDLRQL